MQYRYPCVLILALLLTAVTSSLAQPVWTPIQTPTTSRLLGVDITSASEAFAVGESGAIVRSTDGGNTWQSGTNDFTGNFWGVRFWARDSGFAYGDSGAIYLTADSGATWRRGESGMQQGFIASFLFGSAIVGERLFAVGGDGQNGSGAVLTSTDRGVTWSKKNLQGCLFLDRVAFIDAQRGVTVGLSPTGGGVIFRTTNGGGSWQLVRSTSALVAGVAVAGGERVVAVGSGGMIHTSTDAGATWSAGASPAGGDLLDVAFRGDVGIAVGEPGVVIRTTDAGRTWSDESMSGGEFIGDAAIDPVSGATILSGPSGMVYVGEVVAGIGEGTTRTSFKALGKRVTVVDPSHDVALRLVDMLGRTVATGTHSVVAPAPGLYLVVATTSRGSINAPVALVE
jgi:photosystem II stability/assembly factor-like uncharacterized protein